MSRWSVAVRRRVPAALRQVCCGPEKRVRRKGFLRRQLASSLICAAFLSQERSPAGSLKEKMRRETGKPKECAAFLVQGMPMAGSLKEIMRREQEKQRKGAA